MASKRLAKGFTCQVCKRDHEFDAYVYAHWDIQLEVTCDCGSKFVIREGNSRLLSRGPKKVKT